MAIVCWRETCCGRRFGRRVPWNTARAGFTRRAIQPPGIDAEEGAFPRIVRGFTGVKERCGLSGASGNVAQEAIPGYRNRARNRPIAQRAAAVCSFASQRDAVFSSTKDAMLKRKSTKRYGFPRIVNSNFVWFLTTNCQRARFTAYCRGEPWRFRLEVMVRWNDSDVVFCFILFGLYCVLTEDRLESCRKRKSE